MFSGPKSDSETVVDRFQLGRLTAIIRFPEGLIRRIVLHNRLLAGSLVVIP